MAPVPLKFVVSFSSQDERHPVGNLISGGGFKKWLSAPGLKTGQIEAVFQLETPALITHLDLGSLWCANIEALVGRSSWPQTMPYRTLIATANLMSPMDSRNGNAVVRTRMFNSNDFLEDTCIEEYDRIRVICRQPFRKDVQFGLSFIRVKGNTKNSETKVTEINNPTAVKSPKNNNGGISTSPATAKTGSALTKNLHDRFIKQNPGFSSPSSVQLKNRLLKIDGTSDNGVSKEQSLSRSAKLVLASVNQSPGLTNTTPHKERHKSLFVSNSINNRTSLPFELEVKKFLSRLQINKDDLSAMSLSDLRHRLERRNRRKLTLEEKKKFKQLTEDFLHKKFEGVPAEEVLKETDCGIQFEEITIDLCADEDLQHLSVLSEISANFSDTDLSLQESAFVDFKSIGNSDQNNSTFPDSNFFTNIESKAAIEYLPCKISEGITPAKSNLSETENSKGSFSSKKLFKRGISFSSDLGMSSPSYKSVPSPNTLMNATSTIKVDKTNFGELSVESECDKTTNPLNLSPCQRPMISLRNTSKDSTSKIIDLTPSVDRLGKRPSSLTKCIGTDSRSTKKRSGKKKSDIETKSASSKKRLYSGEKTGSTNERHIGEDVMGAFTMCTECEKLVPQPNYLVHQARCKYLSKTNADATQNASGSKPVRHKKGEPLFSSGWTSTEMDIEYRDPHDNETAVLIECPICSQYFSSDNINTHANVCAELSLLA